MSSFLTPLELEYLDGRTWRLTAPFEYWTDTGKSRDIITVPAGFVTDFASIPRPLWWWLPPTGPYGKAAVVHDWLYTEQPIGFDKARDDRVLLEAMTALGVGRWTRLIIYAGVRTPVSDALYEAHRKALNAHRAVIGGAGGLGAARPDGSL